MVDCDPVDYEGILCLDKEVPVGTQICFIVPDVWIAVFEFRQVGGGSESKVHRGLQGELQSILRLVQEERHDKECHRGLPEESQPVQLELREQGLQLMKADGEVEAAWVNIRAAAPKL
jgi:hypothetical protein